MGVGTKRETSTGSTGIGRRGEQPRVSPEPWGPGVTMDSGQRQAQGSTHQTISPGPGLSVMSTKYDNKDTRVERQGTLMDRVRIWTLTLTRYLAFEMSRFREPVSSQGG